MFADLHGIPRRRGAVTRISRGFTWFVVVLLVLMLVGTLILEASA